MPVSYYSSCEGTVVNLDTGCGNENELSLWSSCDLQAMKLDGGTKEEKAIKNTLLSNSISKWEVSSAVLAWRVLRFSAIPFWGGSGAVLNRCFGVLSSWGRAGETLADLCWQMGIQGFISHAVVSCFAVCRDEKREKSCLSIAEEGF